MPIKRRSEFIKLCNKLKFEEDLEHNGEHMSRTSWEFNAGVLPAFEVHLRSALLRDRSAADSSKRRSAFVHKARLSLGQVAGARIAGHHLAATGNGLNDSAGVDLSDQC